MRVVMIYRADSEFATDIESFMRDFASQTGKTIETLDPDSKDGTDLCRVYDIVQYPTLVALSDDSRLQTMWTGTPLPTISEVSYYA